RGIVSPGGSRGEDRGIDTVRNDLNLFRSRSHTKLPLPVEFAKRRNRIGIMIVHSSDGFVPGKQKPAATNSLVHSVQRHVQLPQIDAVFGKQKAASYHLLL